MGHVVRGLTLVVTNWRNRGRTVDLSRSNDASARAFRMRKRCGRWPISSTTTSTSNWQSSLSANTSGRSIDRKLDRRERRRGLMTKPRFVQIHTLHSYVAEATVASPSGCPSGEPPGRGCPLNASSGTGGPRTTSSLCSTRCRGCRARSRLQKGQPKRDGSSEASRDRFYRPSFSSSVPRQWPADSERWQDTLPQLGAGDNRIRGWLQPSRNDISAS